tara:strand:+ start:471 stop:1535 length:1065 start_codon:yes stop_codon:yes gene_type:complete
MTKAADITNWYSDLDPNTQGDLKDYYTEIAYDHFKNDEIYQTVFAQGSWGSIDDATLETFGEVKTYINDTIFATEHQTVYEEGEYVPTVDRSIGDDPIYLDVSEYYDGTKGNIDKTLPQIYQRPDPVAMPHSMLKYSSRAKLPQFTGGPFHADDQKQKGWDFFWNRPQGTTKRKAEEWGQDGKQVTPGWIHGNIDTLGDYQRHLDQVESDRLEAAHTDFSKFVKDNKKRADEIWKRRTTLEGSRFEDEKYELGNVNFGQYNEETEPLFEEVIGSSDREDIQAWMAMSEIWNLEYENFDDAAEDLMNEGGALSRIKFVYDYFGGKIPTREEFETRGDPLAEWEKDKGKSWREENN